MLYGYAGKVLIANLSDQTYEVRDLDPEWTRLFMGGSGLGARFLYELMPAHTPVFSEESVIGLLGGPSNATPALMGGRFTVCSKSPITGGLNDSNGGGNFGPFLRKAGFDAVFIKGISEKPVYLFINDGEVSFCDASNVWGKTLSISEQIIKQEIGFDRDIGMATIGPGGERMSLMSAVISDTHRAAGRGATAAVMGSKKLKSVVCHGTGTIPIVDREAIVELNKKAAAHKKVFPPCKEFPVVGTSNGYMASVRLGDAGIKNWTGTPDMLTDEEVNNLQGESMDPKFKKKGYGCNGCHIRCGAEYDVKDEELGLDFHGYRPEYESIASLGSNIMNTRDTVLLAGNYYCNEYGYDTLSFGGTIAWLMECYEKGIFTQEELDGIDLKWGDPEATLAIMKKICDYEGIGIPLNLASQGCADHFGKGHECLCVFTGHEPSMHGSRLNPGMARTSQYDPTPGRHTRGGLGVPFKHAPEDQKYNYDGDSFGKKDADGLWEWAFVNCSGFCGFSDFLLPPGPEQHLGYIKAITGNDYSMPEMIKFGKREYTIRAAFNLREGLYRDHWTVSPRLMGKPPLQGGPLKGVTVDNEKLADRFFDAMGYDVATGVPKKETLEELGGLDCVIKDLYPDT